MKINKKNLIFNSVAIALAATLLIGGGVYSYLHVNSDPVVNQFDKKIIDIPGKIEMTLAETTGNTYTIEPGTNQDKDPTVSITNNIDAYVFVKIDDTTENLVTYQIAEGWNVLEGYENVYYREVPASETESKQTFPILKDSKVSYDAGITNQQLKEAGDNLALTFTAYASQKEYFENDIAGAYEASTNENTLKEVSTSTDFQDALKNADTKYIVVSQNIDSDLNAVTNISHDKTLILDHDLIYGDLSGNSSGIQVIGCSLTVNGNRNFKTEKYGDSCFRVNYQANLVINGGNYYANKGVFSMGYTASEMTIHGGFFQSEDDIIIRKDTNAHPTITITGGTFVNYDPSTEGYVADGYTVESTTSVDGDVWYKVVPSTTTK